MIEIGCREPYQVERILNDEFGIKAEAVSSRTIKIDVEPQLSNRTVELFYNDSVILMAEYELCGGLEVFDRKNKKVLMQGCHSSPESWDDIWEECCYDPEDLINIGPTLLVVGY